MSEGSLHEQLPGDVYDRLQTAQTIVAFVRQLNIAFVLRDGDDERFETLTYDAAPTVQAMFCRELAGLSWNGLYEFLSTNARATKLGFDPEKFGKHRSDAPNADDSVG